MANALIFTTLSKIGYPLFRPKLQTVTGTANLPAAGGYVIAANHVDWLDGFYIAAAVGLARRVPVHFLTTSTNYWWTTATIQIPPKHRSHTVDIAAAHLKRGQVMCNFIEGQRNPSNKLLPGKTGTVRMAVAAGVPVVPLGIACSAGRNMAQSTLYLMSRHHHVRIAIGRPLKISPPAGGITKEWLDQATQRVMEAIAPLCDKII